MSNYFKKGEKVRVVKTNITDEVSEGDVGFITMVHKNDPLGLPYYFVRESDKQTDWLEYDQLEPIGTVTRKEKRAGIYSVAIGLWGKKEQLSMLQEEATELALAVRKFVRNPSPKRREQLAEEVADVEIMIEQLKQMEGSKFLKQVAYAKRGKIKRLKDRIEGKGFED